jgi:hypothetical protein
MAAIIEWTARSRWEAPSVLLATGLVAAWLLPSLSAGSRRAVAGEPWYELQSWVRHHTPRNAVILTPPARAGFRVFSERTIVVEEKDGTQQFFDASFGFAWQQRLQHVNSLTKRYQRFSLGVVEGIRQEYGVTHLVLPHGVRSSLPVLFQNEAGSVRSIVPGSLAQEPLSERGARRTRAVR